MPTKESSSRRSSTVRTILENFPQEWALKLLNASVLYTEAFLFHLIGKELEQSAIALTQITEMAFAKHVLSEKGADIRVVRDLLRPFSGNIEVEIRRIEATYGLANARRLLAGDRHFVARDEEEGLRALIAYVQMWEEELEARPVDAIFMDFGGELIRRSLFIVAQRLGIPVLYLNFAPFPRAIAWIDNEYNSWDDLENLPLSSFSEAEVAEIESFIAKLQRSDVQFSNVQAPQITGKRFEKYFEYLRLQWKYERQQNHHFTPERWLAGFARRRITRILEARVQSKLPDNEKFVFFPLHVPDDAQLTVRASVVEQESLITQISKSLPYGYKLYVKGHPAFIGGYSLDMLRRLSSLPNVRIVDPFIHAHTLLRKASAVAVINSTTGFEGLIFGLPVVTMGPTYFRGQGLTYDVSDPMEFESVFARALSAPSPANNEALKRFLLNLRRACYHGSAYFMFSSAGQMTPSMLEANAGKFEEDAKDLAQSILQKLKRLATRGVLANDRGIYL